MSNSSTTSSVKLIHHGPLLCITINATRTYGRGWRAIVFEAAEIYPSLGYEVTPKCVRIDGA